MNFSKEKVYELDNERQVSMAKEKEPLSHFVRHSHWVQTRYTKLNL